MLILDFRSAGLNSCDFRGDASYATWHSIEAIRYQQICHPLTSDF
jgi:hypothetical protein